MVAVFTLTLLLSSTLLFLVQPMVGKMILPALGGAPSVWNTCMVFFQGALLLGYLYAHLSIRWLGVQRQAWLHLLILLLPLTLLPLQLSELRPPTDSDPAWWLLTTLATRVGPVFFVIAASAPLLQRWFAASGHAHASDPYFLYAASNVGSLGALLAYPLLLEPLLPVDAQAGWWSTAYYALLSLFVVCVLVQPRQPATPQQEADASGPPLTNQQRAWWILTALVPSSLMLGVTTHITTNLAAIPLLWVLPLALYLVTFIIVFARRPLWRTEQVARLVPYFVLPLGLLMFIELPSMGWVIVPLHLVVFFVLTLVCHGQLADSRPPAARLTEFYLYMSLGGVLGGIFNALLAPVLFDHLVEYPLMLVIALLLRPRARVDQGRPAWLDLGLPLALGVVAYLATGAARAWTPDSGTIILLVGFLLPTVVCFGFKERPRRFALGLAAILLVCGLDANGRIGDQLRIERNFFGLKRVIATPDQTRYALVHGGIEHGSQYIAPAERSKPLTYYHREGPVGDLFATMHTGARHVGVVGLGVGSVVSYARPGDRFTFFEIDPQVAEMALDPRYFAYLHEASGDYEIVLGDGRLTVAEQPREQYDVLMIDAFGSDSIPTHLLTLEALGDFMQRVRADGILLIHISNRYLDLEPLLGNAAHALGWECRAIIDLAPEAEQSDGRNSSHYVALARDPQRLARLGARPGWREPRREARVGTWSDRHTDLLRVIRWR